MEEPLYSGFIGPADRRVPDRSRSLGGEALSGKRTAFDEVRLQELFVRYRARN